jgi:hypothetical protein
MTVWWLVLATASAAALGGWTWTLHLRQQARVEALEGRVAHLLASVSLLTDTTEGGLRDLAAEIARLGSSSAGRAKPRVAPTRVAPAARRRTTSAVHADVESAIASDDEWLGGRHAEVR